MRLFKNLRQPLGIPTVLALATVGRLACGDEITSHRFSPAVIECWMPDGGFDAQRRAEANLLALELSGELVAPPALRDRILADLNSIRAKVPEMAAIGARAPWVVGEVLVGVNSQLAEQIDGQNLSRFVDLFSELGTPQVSSVTAGLYRFRFDEAYHPDVLAKMFEEICGVDGASSNRIIGDGSDIDMELPYYTFYKKWGDCPAGCIEQRKWTFRVVDGEVTCVPEPSGLALAGLGLAVAVLLAPQRRALQRRRRGQNR